MSLLRLRKRASNANVNNTIDETDERYWNLLVFGWIRLLISKFKLMMPKEIQTMVIDFIFKETHYTFLNNSDIATRFIISNNGLTISGITGMKAKFGTILFGKYFKIENNPHLNFTILVKLHKKVQIGHCGFGFATSEFNDFKQSRYNDGHNHSCVMNLNSYFLDCNEFKTSYKHHRFLIHMKNWIQPKDIKLEQGIIGINIDMKDKMGRVWNYYKNKSYKNNDKVFQVEFPDQVGIVMYYGRMKMGMTVINQFVS